MFAEFLLTDGTTTLDLLGANKRGNGFAITRYTPGRPNLKSGGIWQDSPLARGRRLAYGTHGNVNDALELKITFPAHSEIIAACQALDVLLEKAAAYWLASWQDEPVYIKARAAGESNSRYALIRNASFGEYPSPYEEPYTGRGRRFVMNGILLGIERDAWMAYPPGESTAVLVSHQQAEVAQPVTYIRNVFLPTADGNDYLRKSFDGANLVDADNPTANLPLTLFDTGAAGEFIMFGIGGPVLAGFSSLIFDIGTAFTSSAHSIIWEYSISTTGSSDGVDWGDLTSYLEEDETNGFQNTGLRAVHWDKPGDWIVWFDSPTYPQNDALLWVRARIVSSSGVTAVPTQVNNRIYTPKVPYIDLAEVGGDMNALASIRISIHTIAA